MMFFLGFFTGGVSVLIFMAAIYLNRYRKLETTIYRLQEEIEKIRKGR